MKRLETLILGIGLSSGCCLFAQTQTHYVGSNVSGQLSLTLASPINLLTLSQNAPAPGAINAADFFPEAVHLPYKRPTPPVLAGISSVSLATTQGLSVATATSTGFDGLTHADQRLSNGGYQWSTEPATPAIAVSSNYIVEGVDDAIQVYSTSGTPSLPIVVSANQFFGLLPAINRANPSATFCPGPYLTDMRVFYDPDIQRFIVTEWGQPQGYFSCNNLASSTEWIAVTQTSDPTGNWNIYSMNSTDSATTGCPCVPDYPQIGADLNALYISSNEFDAASETQFVQAQILVLSKADLQSGATNPTMVRFVLQNANGFQFAITPAVTPPGASYYLASGGLEYFVSSLSGFSLGNSLAIWAMSNTSSINTVATEGVNLLLTQTTVATESYSYPNSANEPTALYFPLGQSLFDTVPLISGGPDSRTLSNVYAGGRLYITLQSQVTDGNSKSVVGGAYFILSPAFRSAVLSAPVLRQGYLAVNSNHILRPVAAVTAQGKGAIVFTLVGPSYYPSAAWLPINTTTTGSTIQLAGAGAGPEDGFTGYENPFTGATLNYTTGVARWGDNSAAVVAGDGSIWGITEYIPNLPRTSKANWGTYIMHINP